MGRQRPIPPEIAEKIRQDFAQGVSISQVVRKYPIGFYRAAEIKQGLPQPKADQNETRERCKECGRMIQAPCPACQLERDIRNNKLIREFAPILSTLSENPEP